RNPGLLDPHDRREAIPADLAPPAPRECSSDLDDRRVPRGRGLSMAQPALLPTSRDPISRGDVRESARQARSRTPLDSGQRPPNRQAEGFLPQRVCAVELILCGPRLWHASPLSPRWARVRIHAVLRSREGTSARRATTATKPAASAIARGMVVTRTPPATARSAARTGTTPDSTAAT